MSDEASNESRSASDVDAEIALGEAVGHAFRDRELAATALAHPSHAHEVDGTRGNERLEFLGDAVLDLVVAELLYELHPDWTEGELTRARAALVNKEALAERARAVDLGSLVRLGRTEQRSGGHNKDSVLANCYEAVAGAVYLDGGLDAVTSLVRRSFGDTLSEGGARRDAKTAFQEWAHAHFHTTPGYRLVHDSGIDNDDDRFTVAVQIGDEVWGTGIGRTKRAAERAAAAEALARGVEEK